jgi:hypothetical protein
METVVIDLEGYRKLLNEYKGNFPCRLVLMEGDVLHPKTLKLALDAIFSIHHGNAFRGEDRYEGDISFGVDEVMLHLQKYGYRFNDHPKYAYNKFIEAVGAGLYAHCSSCGLTTTKINPIITDLDSPLSGDAICKSCVLKAKLVELDAERTKLQEELSALLS